MAKLRDMVVNIVPKLDVNKAKSMFAMLTRMGGRALKGIGKGIVKGTKAIGKVSMGINQASELLNKILAIVNKPRGLVQSAMATADMIADTAEAIGSTPARLMYVLKTLSNGGAGMNSTIELIKKFAAKAPDLGITGNIDDAFIGVLREIGSKQGTERQELINKYFGSKAGVLAKDAIAAAMDWDNLRTSVQKSRAYGEAALEGEAASGKVDDIEMEGNIERMLFAKQKRLYDGELSIKKTEEYNKTKTILDTNSEMMAKTNNSILKMEETIDTAIRKAVDFQASILDAFGVFDRLNDVLAVLTKVLDKLNPGQMVNNAKEAVKKTIDAGQEIISNAVDFMTGNKRDGKSD